MNNISSPKIATWLLCGCFLIFSMVVIGGITRLTGSGLSITEWNVVMGAIPPMNNSEWQIAFEKYKQIPQFKLINSDFQLGDFKSIFWWEYIHRLTGRLIGVVFVVPFIYFLITRQLTKVLIRKALFLFVLGGVQGFLGWYMVSSGLSERTSVSHIRLAIHLIAAFITFGFTFWYALELLYPKNENKTEKLSLDFSKRLILPLVILQVIYGAFVAGLHAGKMYNTFPLMDGQLLPTGMNSMIPSWENIFNNPVTVQFIHRLLAYVILLLIFIIWWNCRNLSLGKVHRRSLNILLLAVCIQFLLGVLTLLSVVRIDIAASHQAGAFFLFAATIYMMYNFRNSGSYRTNTL